MCRILSGQCKGLKELKESPSLPGHWRKTGCVLDEDIVREQSVGHLFLFVLQSI